MSASAPSLRPAPANTAERDSSASPCAGRESPACISARWRAHGRAPRGPPARAPGRARRNIHRSPASPRRDGRDAPDRARRRRRLTCAHRPGVAAASNGITTSSTSSPRQAHREPAAHGPGRIAAVADVEATFRHGDPSVVARGAPLPSPARRADRQARRRSAHERDARPVRTTSTPSGCRSRPTGSSRRRRACSPAPRACTTSRPDGREILDGTAGLWCVNAGPRPRGDHRGDPEAGGDAGFRPHLPDGPPDRLPGCADELARSRPPGLDRVFFTNSGSEAVDTALKIALAYHRARGEAQRARLIGRERGYHGVGFGGISVGGIGSNRKRFGALLPDVDHLPHTHDLERNAFSRGQPACTARSSPTRWRRLVALHGADDHRRGDRRAGRGLDRRAAAAERLSGAAAGRSATGTASC